MSRLEWLMGLTGGGGGEKVRVLTNLEWRGKKVNQSFVQNTFKITPTRHSHFHYRVKFQRIVLRTRGTSRKVTFLQATDTAPNCHIKILSLDMPMENIENKDEMRKDVSPTNKVSI